MGKNDKQHDAIESAKRRAAKLGAGNAPLTIAICGDEETAKCASAGQMRESWRHLRDVAKTRRKSGQSPLVALRIQCPGICRFGPVAAAFPSGTWYGGCTPAVIDKMIAHELSPGDDEVVERLSPTGKRS